MKEIKPAFLDNNVPIVLACDNNYVPYTSVLLTSLKANASSKFNYDVLLFQTDISEENKMLLKSCFSDKPNLSLRFIDISSYIKNMKLRVFSYYSEAIYYRLVAPWLLNNYDKILYFDCDLVFDDDVSKLFNTDIGDNYLGAIRDLGMILHRDNPNDNFPRDYFTDILENLNVFNYFNSGVLIMNLKAFRKNLKLQNIVDYIEKKKWRFPDQDVLNLMCQNKTTIVDSRWNTIPETLGGRTIENIKEYIEPKYYQDYLVARDNPAVIHYAMREKPWKYSINLDWKLGQYFWKYAFQSPLLNIVLKHKYKTCSFAELYQLIYIFDKDNLILDLEKNNLIAYYKDLKLASLYKEPTVFDNYMYDSENIYLRGQYRLSYLEEDYLDEVYFGSDNHKYEIKHLSIVKDKTFGDKCILHRYNFEIKIPFKDIKEKNAFNFVYIVKGKQIRNGRFDFGKFFPVDRIYPSQYFVKNNVALQTEIGRLILFPVTKKDEKQLEKSFVKELKTTNNLSKKAKIKVLAKRFIYKKLKPLFKKEIWLISDRDNQAGDNGEALFKYLQKNKLKNVKSYFVISKHSPDYKKMKKIGPVITLESKKFKIFKTLADKLISSHCEFDFCYSVYRQPIADILLNQNIVFLQHGITKDDVSSIFNKKLKNFDMFVTAAKPEYKDIIENQNYGFNESIVKLTGFPRFDYLESNPEKIIAIIPTWRKYCVRHKGNEWIPNVDFTTTEYYEFYHNLLTNKKLNKTLSNNGYKLLFVQHPIMQCFNNYFENLENVELITNACYNELFAKSSLMITDYSSTAFDMAYLKKPIIYTQFDKEKFFGSHTYSEGYFSYENDGFGEVVNEQNKLISLIVEYIENDCKLKDKYKRRIDNFFAYTDKNNCKRVVNEILKIGK